MSVNGSCCCCLLLPVQRAWRSRTKRLPEMEFLEYLGMWEESDEDWLLLDEDDVAENRRAERSRTGR